MLLRLAWLDRNAATAQLCNTFLDDGDDDGDGVECDATTIVSICLSNCDAIPLLFRPSQWFVLNQITRLSLSLSLMMAQVHHTSIEYIYSWLAS